MSDANHDDASGTSKPRRSLLDEIRSMRVDADKGREPELLPARMGRRQISLAALLERVLEQFIAEHAGGSETLQDAQTETERLKLLLGTVDYVLAVDSIDMSDDEKADLMRRAFTELFSYGPLDSLLIDETITTITLEGADKVAIRQGQGELQTRPPLFDDDAHLRRIIHRMLLESGAVLHPDDPIIEASLTVNERPVSVNVAGPPVTLRITADIRIHPPLPATLATLVERGVMNQQAADLVTAIAQSNAGVIVVGESESGKTTLLGVLAQLAASDDAAGMIAVERAGVMHLPEAAQRLTIQWPTPDQEAITFAQQIQAALIHEDARCILVDEVRVDGALAVGPLLSTDLAPRQMWALRGPANAKRLTSALGILARRSTQDSAQGETQLQALYHRLPFVLTVRRRQEKLVLHAISEWQYADGSEYPDLIELMTTGWDGLELTGRRPTHTLDLPESLWSSEDA